MATIGANIDQDFLSGLKQKTGIDDEDFLLREALALYKWFA